jgi:hypothetical protein
MQTNNALSRPIAWLEANKQENYVVLRVAIDLLLFLILFISVSVRTARISRFLCSPLHSSEDCALWISGHVNANVPLFVFALAADLLLAYFVRRKIMRQERAAYQRFRWLLIAHTYIHLFLIIVVIAMQLGGLMILILASAGVNLYMIRRFWTMQTVGDVHAARILETQQMVRESQVQGGQGQGQGANSNLVPMVPVDASGMPVPGGQPIWVAPSAVRPATMVQRNVAPAPQQ